MKYGNVEINKGDTLYWTRIIPTLGIYDVYEIKIRTVKDDYFVGLEKHDKQAFLLNAVDVNKFVFKNRGQALEVVKQAELTYEDYETQTEEN